MLVFLKITILDGRGVGNMQVILRRHTLLLVFVLALTPSFGIGCSSSKTDRSTGRNSMPIMQPNRDLLNAHLFQSKSLDDWFVEMWTDGSLYSTRDTINITLRIYPPKNSEKATGTISYVFKMKQSSQIRNKINKKLECVQVERNERVMLTDNKGSSKYVTLHSNNGWEMSLNDVLENRSKEKDYVPLITGDYLIYMSAAIDNGPKHSFEPIEVSIRNIIP